MPKAPLGEMSNGKVPQRLNAAMNMRMALDGVQRQCGEYQRRRDALCGGLRGIGWNVPEIGRASCRERV